jgi:hypothetical protein
MPRIVTVKSVQIGDEIGHAGAKPPENSGER